MKDRKNAYTGQDSDSKSKTIPHDKLGDEVHNWATSVPSDRDYNRTKEERLPTELEMQAHEIFYFLELARLRVRYYELKLDEIQKQISADYTPKPVKQTKKEKEEELAFKEKEILDEHKDSIEEVIQDRKDKSNLWD